MWLRAILKSDLSHGTKSGAAFLFTCADGNGECFPSHSVIASACGMKERRSAIRLLERLVERGFIEIAVRGGPTHGRRGKSNVYRLLLPEEIVSDGTPPIGGDSVRPDTKIVSGESLHSVRPDTKMVSDGTHQQSINRPRTSSSSDDDGSLREGDEENANASEVVGHLQDRYGFDLTGASKVAADHPDATIEAIDESLQGCEVNGARNEQAVRFARLRDQLATVTAKHIEDRAIRKQLTDVEALAIAEYESHRAEVDAVEIPPWEIDDLRRAAQRTLEDYLCVARASSGVVSDFLRTPGRADPRAVRWMIYRAWQREEESRASATSALA